ncbi:hypothetical protein Pth03_25950 [Planotetraspora thailandica]|uniref:Uncharacterized protein n=1 Tax=Planotetraspora thailandica TaxID=487172 RepID=A0A8J3V081_9ACTN|nr:hypothetical protein [Planotetraspora thailandica]GII54206.1 hypothetical protein Pth03_25950 [Planotetraspora thailandica]
MHDAPKREPGTEETPRDVIEIRAGSVLFILALTVAVASAAVGVTIATIVFGVVALSAVIQMVAALRRRTARALPDEDDSRRRR